MSLGYKYCSGVLPFCYYNKSVFFLLGRSRRNNRLVTFSGKNDLIEDDPCETAARECYEETLGCLMDKKSLVDKIVKCKDSSILPSRTPRGMPCYTFLVEVPFKKHYVLTFHKTKSFINSINIKEHSLMEMTDIKWICAKSMTTKIKRLWQKSGILLDESQWDKIDSLSTTRVPDAQWRSDLGGGPGDGPVPIP